jgi:hypothetical protein
MDENYNKNVHVFGILTLVYVITQIILGEE